MSLSGTGDNVGNAQYLVGASNGSFLEPLGGTNQPFTMSLKLTDGPSGLSDVMTFHGTVTAYPYLGLSGAHAGGVFYSFSDGIGSIVIGQDTYHIQLSDGSLAWGRPDPTPDIAAKINVTTAATAPEPSSLLLAVMALPMLGFTRWKKRAAPTSKS